MFIFIAVTVFTLIIILSIIKHYNAIKNYDIPGPYPLPIVGNAISFFGDQEKFLRTIGNYCNTYNGICQIFLFHFRYIIVCHPKYIEPILSSSELIVKGKSYDFTRPWLGNGLLTSTGHKWKVHRKFLTPAFHFNILKNFLPIFCKNEKILIKKLLQQTGTNLNIFPIIALTALDNVAESIMGVSVNAQTNSESNYVSAIEAISNIISMRMKNPILGENAIFNLTPYKTYQDKALQILHNQSKGVIEARREELKRSNINSLPTGSDIGMKNNNTFLDLLLLAEIDGKRIDDETVREEVDTFMFEGHDTTTSGIVFTLYCLSKYRDVQDKVLKELESILGDNLHSDPTYTQLQQMKYLELVIKESLRLYPSVPLIERKMTRDCNVGGTCIPKNSSFLIDIFHMQRNPEVYDKPMEFIPERFERPLNNAFAWIPFSAGPRNCIGQKFAIMEMKVTVAAVVKNFIIMAGDAEPKLSAEMILRSGNGVLIKLQPRNFIS